jgi:hypothetical protein
MQHRNHLYNLRDKLHNQQVMVQVSFNPPG